MSPPGDQGEHQPLGQLDCMYPRYEVQKHHRPQLNPEHPIRLILIGGCCVKYLICILNDQALPRQEGRAVDRPEAAKEP